MIEEGNGEGCVLEDKGINHWTEKYKHVFYLNQFYINGKDV
jgi:hypothetical protein